MPARPSTQEERTLLDRKLIDEKYPKQNRFSKTGEDFRKKEVRRLRRLRRLRRHQRRQRQDLRPIARRRHRRRPPPAARRPPARPPASPLLVLTRCRRTGPLRYPQARKRKMGQQNSGGDWVREPLPRHFRAAAFPTHLRHTPPSHTSEPLPRHFRGASLAGTRRLLLRSR